LQIFSLSLAVKELWNSINIWRRYWQELDVWFLTRDEIVIPQRDNCGAYTSLTLPVLQPVFVRRENMQCSLLVRWSICVNITFHIFAFCDSKWSGSDSGSCQKSNVFYTNGMHKAQTPLTATSCRTACRTTSCTTNRKQIETLQQIHAVSIYLFFIYLFIYFIELDMHNMLYSLLYDLLSNESTTNRSSGV